MSRSTAAMVASALPLALTASALFGASPATAAPFPVATGAARSAAGSVVADTFINQAAQNAKAGTAKYLAVGQSTTTRDGLLRVTIPALPSNARHPHAALVLSGAGAGGSVGISTAGSFDELTTTWKSRPAIGSTPFATAVVPATGEARLDLTSVLPVGGTATTLNLALVPLGAPSADVRIGSRESTRAPRVEISWNECSGVTDILLPDCMDQTLFGAAAGKAESPGMTKTEVFRAAEARYGRKIPVWRLYVLPGQVPFQPGTATTDAANAQIADGGIVQMNWKPNPDWSQATGANATVNQAIDQAAANIKAVGAKIMLTLNHEPDNDIGGGTSCSYKGTIAGNTPANYVAMWRYIHDRFAALGVSNVVWVTGYMGFSANECARISMWPGDTYVDILGFDKYWGAKGSPTIDAAVGQVYRWFMANSGPGHAFASKPFALMETGMNNPTASQQVAYDGYADLAAAITNHTYPNLRLVVAWDSNGDGKAVRTDLDGLNVPDPVEEAKFKDLVSIPNLQTLPTSAS